MFVNDHAGERVGEKVRDFYYHLVDNREKYDIVTELKVLASRVRRIAEGYNIVYGEYGPRDRSLVNTIKSLVTARKYDADEYDDEPEAMYDDQQTRRYDLRG